MDEIYLREIDRYSLLSKDEEKEIAIKYKKSGHVADAQKLITSNLRYVVRVANEFSRRYRDIDVMELIQDGNLGLMKALENFEPERGNRLITYADSWIRSYIQTSIGKSMNICSGMMAKNKTILFTKLCIDNTILSDVDMDTFEEENNALRSECNIEKSLSEKKWLIEVHKSLDGIKGRDRFIIENRLMSNNPLKQKDVAKHYNISRERARQIETKLKVRMKRIFMKNPDIMEFICG